MGSHETEGAHRLVFFTGRERSENEDRDTNESLLKESEENDDIVQVSISSTFYERIFCTKVHSKPNSKQRKDFSTKNARVKC